MLFRAAAFAAFVAGCESLDTFNYGAFLRTGTFSVASQMGFFQQVGLNVIFMQVGSSADAFAGLKNGTYELLTATIDNSLNLFYNQGSPVRVLGQLDQGPSLCLAASPSITSISQLKGKPLLVDAVTSGYSALLQDILQQKAGLSFANGDYTMVTGGGTQQRYNALLAGTTLATMLTYPFPVMGEALPANQRPNILANVSSLPGAMPVTSSAFTVFEPSITDPVQRPKIIKFLTAMYAATQFLQNPDNKACAVTAIMNDLAVTQAVAEQEYLAVVDPVSGEISGPTNNYTVSNQGIMNDVTIRQNIPGGFTNKPDTSLLFPPATNSLIDYELRDLAVAAFNANPLNGTCKIPVSEPTTGGTFHACDQNNWVGNCNTPSWKDHECVSLKGQPYDQKLHSFGPSVGNCTWYSDYNCQDPIFGATDVFNPGTSAAGSPFVSSVMCQSPPPVKPVGSGLTFMCPLPGWQPDHPNSPLVDHTGTQLECQDWVWNSYECHPFTNTIFMNRLGSFGPQQDKGHCTIYSDTSCAHAISTLINVAFPGKSDIWGAGSGSGSVAQAMMCI